IEFNDLEKQAKATAHDLSNFKMSTLNTFSTMNEVLDSRKISYDDKGRMTSPFNLTREVQGSLLKPSQSQSKITQNSTNGKNGGRPSETNYMSLFGRSVEVDMDLRSEGACCSNKIGVGMCPPGCNLPCCASRNVIIRNGPTLNQPPPYLPSAPPLMIRQFPPQQQMTQQQMGQQQMGQQQMGQQQLN
ncbi:unnamed protein product, partial [Sphagnum balticum]